MSTRSSIAVLQERDGSVISIYCHWDGYLSGVGETLLNHYNTYERANELVALGALSSLYENLNPLSEAPEAFPKQDVPEIITTHSFERPQKNVTVAYHRDRKQKFEQQVHTSFEKYKEDNDFQSYNYIFMGGQWYFMNTRIKSAEWIKLTPDEIKKEK
jgi:hypothetical protein